MKPRIATALPLLAAAVPAAPARAQDGDGGTGGATPDDEPLAPLTVGGLMGGSVRWTGSVAGPGTVHVERLDEASATWSEVGTATAGDDGAFTATWPADALGATTVRAVREGDDPGSAPTTRATVYRGARATWYGPGLYGRRLACGGRLRTSTLGVAHRRLPCGTPVQIFYDGRSITVPVIDRGPFANGAFYDLTEATADALGMKETVRLGVAPRPAAASASRPKKRS